MISIDPFGQDYLRLALEIDRLDEDYIDAYWGPPDLKAEVEAGERKDSPALLDDLASLRARLPEGDEQRLVTLMARLHAMECTLRKLGGEEFDYFDEARRLFDIKPEPVDEVAFEVAHNELDSLLPAGGSLAERRTRWEESFKIPRENVPAVLELVYAETRQRTQALVDLPETERVETALVENKPWMANSVYRGNADSLVEYNLDIPLSAAEITKLVAHEAYPGHHTEFMLKDRAYYQARGWAEHAAIILTSPALVISEGIAMTAVEAIFPGDNHFEWVAGEVLSAAGLPPVAAQQMRRYDAASTSLIREVIDNVSIKVHTGELAGEEQALDYLRTYILLSDEERLGQIVTFVKHAGTYAHTYLAGYRLIEKAAQTNGGDKTAIFKRLLVEDVLPSQLAHF